MDAAEFRVKAKEVVDFIADYMETVGNRRVSPTVRPGYLTGTFPEFPPTEPEAFEDLMEDFHNVILPGVSLLFGTCRHVWKHFFPLLQESKRPPLIASPLMPILELS
jgi:hypothetical protein